MSYLVWFATACQSVNDAEMFVIWSVFVQALNVWPSSAENDKDFSSCSICNNTRREKQEVNLYTKNRLNCANGLQRKGVNVSRNVNWKPGRKYWLPYRGKEKTPEKLKPAHKLWQLFLGKAVCWKIFVGDISAFLSLYNFFNFTLTFWRGDTGRFLTTIFNVVNVAVISMRFVKDF